MASAAIEIHDAGLAAVREGGVAPVVSSPGYALFDSGEILTGRAALRKARLFPRHCHTRFWDPLDSSPLAKPFPASLSRADLAHAHLGGVWNELGKGIDRVVLLVPGFWSSEELGLLLGIARSLEIPVTALVDLSLAAALGAPSVNRSAIVLDVYLHRAAGARVSRGEDLDRESVATTDGAGLVALENAWSTHLAQKFVRETRFDPLHAAASEQKLYDALPALLDALREEETAVLALEGGGKKHSLEVSRRELLQIAVPYYRKIAELAASLGSSSRGEPALVLSPHLAALPGIAEILARDVSANAVPLPPGSAAVSVLARRSRLPRPEKNGGLIFVTRISLQEQDAPAAPVTPRTDGGALSTTHVLHEGIAYPIDPAPFLIGVAVPEGYRGLTLNGATAGISRHHVTLHRAEGRLLVEDHSRYGSFLNGERIVREAALKAGDRLRLGTPGIEVLFISVKG